MGYVPKVKVASAHRHLHARHCFWMYPGNPKKYSHFTSAEPVAEEKDYLGHK